MNIYQIENVSRNDGNIYFYKEENKAIKELEIEYELYIKEFKNKDKTRYETCLIYKKLLTKTNNLKEAIKLSGLDEEDVMCDLKLDNLNKEITFKECEYILNKVEDEEIDNLFEIVEDKITFSIGENGKYIDKEFAYNYFKERIKSELDYEFINKDNLFEILEYSEDEEDFKEEIFENIKVLDGIKVVDLGLTKEDFKEELSTLYEDCHISKIIDIYKKEKEYEKEYDKTYNTRYSSSYIYIGYIEDRPEIMVCNERCIPEYFEVIEEIDTDNFEYIKQQYLKLYSNLKLELPEQGDNKELYCFLRENTNIPKEKLLKLFKNNNIYQDTNRNMVFVAKNEQGENIGGYKWDIYNKSKDFELISNSNMSQKQQDDISDFAKNLYTQVFKQEELQIEEDNFEIEF